MITIRCALASIVMTAGVGCAGPDGATPPPEPGRTLVIESTAFDDGGAIPAPHTCDAQDVSPPLAWDDVPGDAVEIAVLMEDPGAPGGVFVHWVAAGIDPAARRLAEGEAPPAQGTNDFGRTGYGGPCPPPGDDPHRYVITVFASARTLQLPPGWSAPQLRAALGEAELARGQLTGTYGR